MICIGGPMEIKAKIRYLLIVLVCCSSFSYSQGILFRGIGEGPIKQRTSMQIFLKGKEPTIQNRFKLQFELYIRTISCSGYIFLLRETNTSRDFSFSYNYFDGKSSTFKFNTYGVKNHYTLKISNSEIAYKWIPISLDFNIPRQSLKIRIGQHENTIEHIDVSNPFIPSLCMGLYDYIIDIPIFSIRNLHIVGDDKSFSFPLNESRGENIHDASGKILGHVTNAEWLSNRSFYWEPLYKLYSRTPSGTSFNPQMQQLITFNQDSAFLFNPWTRKMERVRYKNPLPVKLLLATHFFNDNDGKLYAYELNSLPIGDPTVACFDFKNLTWTKVGTASLPVQLHHHDGFWNKRTHKYMVFGGFGNQRFNNTFLEYDIASDRWDTIAFKGDRITPRYVSGMVVDKNDRYAYIYGGMGNESGDQTLGRNYNHDLYKIDLVKQTIQRIWVKNSTEKLVTCRNMILSQDQKYIYAICYPEYVTDTFLQLYRINLQNFSMEQVGDPIPMKSDEIKTNANLYYNDQLKELYCVIEEFQSNGSSTVRVYSIADPPISKAEINLYDSEYSHGPLWIRVMIASAVLLFLLLVAAILLNKKKKKKQTLKNADSAEQSETASNAPSVSSPLTEAKCNAIYLFGSFTVLNRKGRDITYLFSPRLRQIFIYILLHWKDGVFSSNLNEVFWSDKPVDKIKNLKGVSINQIRKILMELDGIELVYEKGYFRIVVTDCYCDYFQFLKLKEEPNGDKEIAALLIRGKFLEGFEVELFDRFKLNVEESLLAFLPIEIDRLYQAHQYDMVIRFCHVLFYIDPLDEEALIYCLHALLQTGATQEAIIQYSNFTSEYKSTQNTEYFTSYKELILKKPCFNRKRS
jgi:DNA-binding SARP family transcriptional activator